MNPHVPFLILPVFFLCLSFVLLNICKIIIIMLPSFFFLSIKIIIIVHRGPSSLLLLIIIISLHSLWNETKFFSHHICRFDPYAYWFVVVVANFVSHHFYLSKNLCAKETERNRKRRKKQTPGMFNTKVEDEWFLKLYKISTKLMVPFL